MCTAYKIGPDAGRLPGWLLEDAVVGLLGMKETRVVRPTLRAPVVLPGGGMAEMAWGFRRTFKGKTGRAVSRTVVNSREDKLASPMWREAFLHRRCLIPARAFYEWVGGARGGMMPLEFSASSGAWLWIAGIWEEGPAGLCFSMITTEPTAEIAAVHDRMPAVLEDQAMLPFIQGELNELGPSRVALRWAEVENFLIRDKPDPRSEERQGWLL